MGLCREVTTTSAAPNRRTRRPAGLLRPKDLSSRPRLRRGDHRQRRDRCEERDAAGEERLRREAGEGVRHGEHDRESSTKASYDWRCSLDGETWKDHQDVAGLVAGQVYFFRDRTPTEAGTGDWGQVVSLRVA